MEKEADISEPILNLPTQQVKLSMSLTTLADILTGVPIHIESIHCSDPASKEAIRKLLLQLI